MQNRKGFTLIELMITVALLAILAAVAIPSFQNSIYRNYSDTATSDVAALVRLARSEALLRAGEVRICDSDALETASDKPVGHCKDDGNDWGGDVVVTALKQDRSGYETIARLSVGGSTNATATADLASPIVFDLQGRLVGDQRTIKFCDKKNVACREITITARGRTHIEKASVSSTP